LTEHPPHDDDAAMRARTNGIELEYEMFGSPGDPTLLLVMGFSLQMIDWDGRFCETLAARGFRVIRFDNRDVGLSSQITGGPVPDVRALMTGDTSSASYALDDMAKDAVGLLDALDVPAAHFVGMSMGGMISQLAAIAAPDRVRSLCSIMSTTGNRKVGNATPAALGVLLTPVPNAREANIARNLEIWRTLASPSHPIDEVATRARAERSFDRAFHPAGGGRQLAAILSARDRTDELGRVRAPTVVIHGTDDPLIAPDGGEATARAIPGAELVLIPEMGHELPPRVWPRVIDAIVTNAKRA
jgi:pimeloyl-ACP methyl ester carboxylesterase